MSVKLFLKVCQEPDLSGFIRVTTNVHKKSIYLVADSVSQVTTSEKHWASFIRSFCLTTYAEEVPYYEIRDGDTGELIRSGRIPPLPTSKLRLVKNEW